MARIGLSFSGGGIRSAAFCSGVLRRMLQKDVKLDYLSCVSGGGYTGTAYLDWKYRNGKRDEKKWHQEFFNHMRQGAGLICHWNKPFQAILEFMAIFSLTFFVTILVPGLMWVAFAFPVAYVVDHLFGELLRGGGPPCPKVSRHNPNITIEQCRQGRESKNGIYHLFALFLVPLAIAFMSFLLKRFIPKAKHLFSFLITSCTVFFALVFFPWFIKEFLRFVPTGFKLVIIVPLFFIWISFPSIRSAATLMTAVYFCSFVIFWKVFNEISLGFEYERGTFDLLLGFAAIVQWTAPLLVTVQQHLVHVYVR